MRQETLNLAILATFLLLFISCESNEASRLFNGEFEEAWMKAGNLLLSSLQRGPVRPPGNGCNGTGNGGNNCVGSRKFGGGHGGVTTPPPPPQLVIPSSEV